MYILFATLNETYTKLYHNPLKCQQYWNLNKKKIFRGGDIIELIISVRSIPKFDRAPQSDYLDYQKYRKL